MKDVKRNDKLTVLSQNLRHKMTKEESHLWYDFLKNIPITVHRQYVIGQYIADFYIASKNIVIELDGKGHFEEGQMENDKKRDEYMKSKGIIVLRYTNKDIHKRFNVVCEEIKQILGLVDKE